MATTGGGRGPLRPVPAAISNPVQNSRERAAEYESNRLNNIELDRLRKQRDTIVANLAVGDESGIIGEINVLHQDRDELQKLKPQLAQLAELNLQLDKIKDAVFEDDFDKIIPAIILKDTQIRTLSAQVVKLPALQTFRKL